MGDPLLEKAATSVLAKVAATLPDDRDQFMFHAISRVYRPDARYGATSGVEAVREACWKEEALQIRYADKSNAATGRVILPLAVMSTDQTLMILASCCLREAFRMFRGDRIAEVKATRTSFRSRRVALLRSYLGELERSSGGRPAAPSD
ncbi:helix-turn-helix transcriptional regulator [Pseudoroseomonas ludipueritiae]|uniref:helix-turn-helix transcriptional regulator n=1 Tax=Pseudoroseomonas ludipueritiae TaxID=198093 RepID=UPI001934B4BB|nr:WYL domain-containing protein [Pseudoroseomonas ludipueritiae]MCG7364458.1 WYL domain-containing protein [Roseomonas sp. ACRSG]